MRRPALLALVLLAGCALPPEKEEVDAALSVLRDRTVSGAEPLDSELMEIADELAGDSTEAARHEVAVLNVGSDAFTARIHAIRAARESIEVQTFAWAPDDAGTLLFQELVQAARRGVRIRVLADHMGRSAGGEGLVTALLAHENLEIRLYNPTANLDIVSNRKALFAVVNDFGLLNHRMHNKVFVVDGRLGIVGGRNVQDRYFDLDPEFEFIDRDVLVLGPAVAEMERSFDGYWENDHAVPAEYLYDIRYRVVDLMEVGRSPGFELRDFPRCTWAVERASKREAAEVMPYSPLMEADEVTFYADPPAKRDVEGRLVRDMGLPARIVDLAEERVIVQSNYCIFTDRIFENLKELHQTKPQVRVQFGTNSLAAAGCHYCWAIYRKQRMAMVDYGMRLYEFRPLPADVRRLNPRYDELVKEDTRLGEEHDPYDDDLVTAPGYGPQFAIHAKTLVVDGEWTLIGSHNFDPRSELHNTEAAVVIHDPDVGAAVEAELRMAIENRNSWTVAPEPRPPVWRQINGLFASISRTLPVLDVWPFYVNTCWELREGAEPVDIEHPDFHANYVNVGNFPETPFGWKKVQAVLMGVFGGFATSLL